jgi:hypothetical protein
LKTPEQEEIFRQLSDHVQRIGRRINSPKNDLDDLIQLEQSLKLSAETLSILRHIMILQAE